LVISWDFVARPGVTVRLFSEEAEGGVRVWIAWDPIEYANAHPELPPARKVRYDTYGLDKLYPGLGVAVRALIAAGGSLDNIFDPFTWAKMAILNEGIGSTSYASLDPPELTPREVPVREVEGVGEHYRIQDQWFPVIGQISVYWKSIGIAKKELLCASRCARLRTARESLAELKVPDDIDLIRILQNTISDLQREIRLVGCSCD
jgi:hypothetical protein